MLKKIFLIILFFSFLEGCGYTPLYDSNNKVNFNIKEISLEGDWETNNFIKNAILKNSSKTSENYYNLIINTDYSKNPVTKDSTGKTSSYEVVIKVEFFVISKNLEKKFFIQEKFFLENFTDELEEKKLEKSIKENLANLIVNKFKIKLIH